MAALASVSKRTQAVYQRYYEDREATRFQNLYAIFVELSTFVNANESGLRIDIDLLRLAEIVRSYFLDTIRYKEYHLDPKSDSPEVRQFLASQGVESIDDLEPLSDAWTELVHRTARINGSKVAAYTVKWILKCRPIGVVSQLPLAERVAAFNETHRPVGQAPFIANINEHFAALCALAALGIRASDIAPEKLDELVYCFRFRPFEESAYFMILSEEYLCAKKPA